MPPKLTDLAPVDVALFADVGETVSFHAKATERDNDVVTLTWFVDGSELATMAGSSSSYAAWLAAFGLAALLYRRRGTWTAGRPYRRRRLLG